MAWSTKFTEKDEKLAKQIRKLRKLKGFTQEELAEKAGVSTPTIGYIEIGQKRPSLGVVYRIAHVLNVRVQDLFTF